MLDSKLKKSQEFLEAKNGCVRLVQIWGLDSWSAVL